MSDSKKYLHDDFFALLSLSYEGDEGLRAVAAFLRRGEIDQRNLNLLANIIDPDGQSFIGEKLVVKREKGHRPRRRRNHELAQFMERNIDFYGEKYEAVIAAAKVKFGVGKTACDEALARARKRSREDTDFFELRKESALMLREGGDPKFAPLA